MTPTSIAAGSAHGSSLRVGAFDVSDVVFPPDCRLPWHAHPRGCLAIVVSGAVRKRFRGSEDELREGGLVTMPPDEPHEDAFGSDGTRLVVVEADDGVRSVSCGRNWEATLLAFRIARELADRDDFTPLALEGLALELTAVSARRPSARRPEPWLERARDLLHEHPRTPPSATALAREVGVHPSHLAREFRAHFGDSPGGYARRLRLEWAATRLVASDTSLACLAAEAGFVDQSHFTRAFRRRFGVTPGRFRRASR